MVHGPVGHRRLPRPGPPVAGAPGRGHGPPAHRPDRAGCAPVSRWTRARRHGAPRHRAARRRCAPTGWGSAGRGPARRRAGCRCAPVVVCPVGRSWGACLPAVVAQAVTGPAIASGSAMASSPDEPGSRAPAARGRRAPYLPVPQRRARAPGSPHPAGRRPDVCGPGGPSPPRRRATAASAGPSAPAGHATLVPGPRPRRARVCPWARAGPHRSPTGADVSAVPGSVAPHGEPGPCCCPPRSWRSRRPRPAPPRSAPPRSAVPRSAPPRPSRRGPSRSGPGRSGPGRSDPGRHRGTAGVGTGSVAAGPATRTAPTSRRAPAPPMSRMRASSPATPAARTAPPPPATPSSW